MAEELDAEERELLARHRAKKAKAKPGRKVIVRGKHESGDYEFELDGDEAERVVARHRAPWADEDGPEDDAGEPDGEGEGDGEDDGSEGGQAGPARGGKRPAGAAGGAAGTARKGPYFKTSR